jgi:hypothetical protein
VVLLNRGLFTQLAEKYQLLGLEIEVSTSQAQIYHEWLILLRLLATKNARLGWQAGILSEWKL